MVYSAFIAALENDMLFALAIRDNSMFPILQKGDIVLVSILLPPFSKLQRGDLVVFPNPPKEQPKVLQVDLCRKEWDRPLYDAGALANPSLVNAHIIVPDPLLRLLLISISVRFEPNVERLVRKYRLKQIADISSDHLIVRSSLHEARLCDALWNPVNLQSFLGKPLFRLWPPSRVGFLLNQTR